MKKHRSIRYVAAAAIAGSALAAVAAPAAVAGASKPPVFATCTNSLGAGTGITITNILLSGCTTDGAPLVTSHITATGVQVVDPGNTTGTIYWTDKKTTTVSFAYTYGGPGDCLSFLGVGATAQVTETITVTGGNAKLALAAAAATQSCAYAGGSDIVITQDNGPSGTGVHL